MNVRSGRDTVYRIGVSYKCIYYRDLRSFEIRFDSKVLGRFENFPIGRVCPLLAKRLKPLTTLNGTVYTDSLALWVIIRRYCLAYVLENWNEESGVPHISFWFDSYSIRTQTADSQVPSTYVARIRLYRTTLYHRSLFVKQPTSYWKSNNYCRLQTFSINQSQQICRERMNQRLQRQRFSISGLK